MFKKELYDLLVSYGMTDAEIDEFKGKLLANAESFADAKKAAEQQLEFNEDVKKGLQNTIADAQMRLEKAQSIISKVSDVVAVAEEVKIG